MIDRQFGDVTFECDGCDDTVETGESEWSDAMASFKRLNWRAEKVGNDFLEAQDAIKPKDGNNLTPAEWGKVMDYLEC